jgi:N-acetylglucosaminyldiphosphoundecaprenol N-acetyl-beta-D-mannosaminyltransferase
MKMTAAELALNETVSDDIVEVMGLRLHNLDRAAITRRIVAAAYTKQKTLVVNANAQLVVLSQKMPWIRTLFAQADIAFCDGAGVQLASRLLTGRSVHRTTPVDWIGTVLDSLGPQASIFWLGGRADVVEKAARSYETRYGVRTAGVQHGYFDMSENSADTLAVVERINRAGPSILLVNMGMPLQERWLWDNWHKLQPGVAITGGALVDHAAGLVSRPPQWVSNIGAEWFVRLVREPRRLWRRYIFGLPLFGIYVMRYGFGAKSK